MLRYSINIIPYIPPLFHDNKFIVDFKEKREVFNSFFAKQCLLLDIGSTLPSLFLLIVYKSLPGVDFSMLDSRNIPGKSDSIKAHADDLSIFACLNYVINLFASLLTLYFPMFPFDRPENIRKPKVF